MQKIKNWLPFAMLVIAILQFIYARKQYREYKRALDAAINCKQ